MEECDRYIFAVFLVNDFKTGDDEEQGYVSSKSDAPDSEYRIKLSREEAIRMPYWKYHANENDPGKSAWSKGLHRYLEDDEASMILRDIVMVKK